MKRRGLIAAPFVLGALAAPSRSWLLATLDSFADDHGARQVDMKQRATTRPALAARLPHRISETVRDLKRRLKPFASLPQVQAFHTHAQTHLGIPA